MGYHMILGPPEILAGRLEILNRKGAPLARILLLDARDQPVDTVFRSESPLELKNQVVHRGEYRLPVICELPVSLSSRFDCEQVQLNKEPYSIWHNIYRSDELPQDVLRAIADKRVLCLVILNDASPIDQAVMSILGPE
jgi:hypothetical protein